MILGSIIFQVLGVEMSEKYIVEQNMPPVKTTALAVLMVKVCRIYKQREEFAYEHVHFLVTNNRTGPDQRSVQVIAMGFYFYSDNTHLVFLNGC